MSLDLAKAKEWGRGGTLACHTPFTGVPFGVAHPRDNNQAKRRFSKFSGAGKKGCLAGGQGVAV